jgi:hypothetical protein
MDPIHPIVPVTPHILPILPTTKAGHVDRDGARDPAEQQRRKRRPANGGDPDPTAGELPSAQEDDGLGHVDLTA